MTGTEGLAARVAALEDRQAICDLLARYYKFYDENDIDRQADLLTEDCVSDFGVWHGGELVGREPFRQLDSAWIPPSAGMSG